MIIDRQNENDRIHGSFYKWFYNISEHLVPLQEFTLKWVLQLRRK